MQTRKITEGALLSAIVGVLLFLDRQSAGMFNFALYWIIPTPMIVYIAKYNVKDALMPMTTITILALVLSTPAAVYYVLMACVIAYWYGYGLKKKFDNIKLLIISSVISIVSAFLTMFVFATLFGYDIQTDIVLMQETMQDMAGMLGSSVDMDTMFAMIPAIVIASVVLSGVLEGVLIHMITNVVLTRLKLVVQPLKSLFQLKLSKRAGIAGAILLLVMMYGSQNASTEYLKNMSVFGYLIIAFVFLANGYLSILTILAYYNKRKFAILLIFILPFLLVIGIFDSLFNLREAATLGRQPLE